MLFKKVLWFTDSHLGRNGNSPVANQDTLEFFDWAIDRGRSWGAETCIFGGDFYDSRYSIGLATLAAGVEGLEKINIGFENIFFLLGNHDLFYREKRDISSIEFARKFSNIRLIRDPEVIDDVLFLPWLVGDEYKTVRKIKSRYCFGHLELGGFMMNSAVLLPDAPNLLKPDAFPDQEFVFTGHFHKRQSAKNIIYTGNCFPFNFSDNWDEDRGIMLLEWGKQPIFETWSEQPLFRTAKMSEILEDPNKILRPKATIRATMDMALQFEEIQDLKTTLEKEYQLRKFELLNSGEDEEQNFKDDKIEFKSIDQMVIEGIMSVDSGTIRKERLAEIYQDLI